MTELAYLADIDSAYVRSFRARITALPPGGVVLDRTYFYPTGGGQPTDQGELRRTDGPPSSVREVTKSAGTVVHRLARAHGPPPAWGVGDELEGVLDWPRRHRHMRLHTAQHLLSALLFRRSGLRTSRVVMGGVAGNVELLGRWGPENDLAEVEAELAAAIRAALPVSVRWVSRAGWEADPAGRSGLSPLAPEVDPVRLIEIGDLDRCPCGGTHVRSTSELGAVALEGPEPLPAGTCRVRFTLAGDGPPTRPG